MFHWSFSKDAATGLLFFTVQLIALADVKGTTWSQLLAEGLITDYARALRGLTIAGRMGLEVAE